MKPSNSGNPKVIWLTGLSGAGKSTLAQSLKLSMVQQGASVYVLDGDLLRNGLNSDLGFDDKSRSENIRRAVEVAKILYEANVTVIAAFISPFRKDRDWARAQFPKQSFIEIYLDTPIEICEYRDVKGLYKKARQGLVEHMTGINSTYEPPLIPELMMNTADKSIEACTRELLSLMGSDS